MREIASRRAFHQRFGDSPHVVADPATSDDSRFPALVIVDCPLDDPTARTLIAELDGELSAAYPEPGANHFSLSADDVAGGAFLVAWLDGRPVGCGAIRRLDVERVEVKRMYVRPAERGRRIGGAIVEELERRARVIGATTLVLETGTRQAEALGLYERLGYRRCDCWGEYLATPTSVCFTKPVEQLPG